MAVREYTGLSQIKGPLAIIENIKDVKYDEVVDIIHNNQKRSGKVIMVSEDAAVIQIFEGTQGLSLGDTTVRFLGKPLEINLSPDILGRTFDGLGRPIDGMGEIISKKSVDINGSAINPAAREYPRNFIQTGVSAIDSMLTLIRGQKLPIFSGNGLPHNKLAVQIAKQAKLKSNEEFAVVFGAIGLKKDDANFIIKNFEESGSIKNMVVFLNLASDPIVERIATPRIALTVAEYLAFELGKHVLVILNDMTNYCEALRELSNYRGEIPGRKGFPGYLYSDLASIYERAGMIRGKEGSVTQIPILTMPNDDITHPIPDLTGFITEGQIVLSRDLHRKNIYPPISVLPSLSRLMKDGIGKGYTREDHPDISSQLFAAYSRVFEIRSLAAIIGEEDLSDIDKLYLKFGKEFEEKFINQGFDEERPLEKTLDLAWEMLSILPETELTRVKKAYIEKYYKPQNA
ncbi:ATP synthase subunit B [Marinitoga sp. 1135]|uniref:V-type ATP synthase beta chain n=1 Tax=Marinitoga piezophila (strain DSM 14283 / JCM 11233 / KA3) TaxID=443254 RepID=H2J5L6_MARPK|nr:MULTISPECIES: V-type ATP synthase subunit B [Marinitoga]AEX85002.1 archaeal/vacuolar-type H+-ATPase subunit B [Marinitoga piezophila KA3]APT75506.1 ATP synthase subunit B [Marinitoga sp. 1137]NUU95228.1 ATP synthase subunit B [Marinitoga sp. 1135]NUU97161.1 ATP synthase subunit B [Marinitoga sp. 1138]